MAAEPSPTQKVTGLRVAILQLLMQCLWIQAVHSLAGALKTAASATNSAQLAVPLLARQLPQESVSSFKSKTAVVMAINNQAKPNGAARKFLPGNAFPTLESVKT